MSPITTPSLLLQPILGGRKRKAAADTAHCEALKTTALAQFRCTKKHRSSFALKRKQQHSLTRSVGKGCAHFALFCGRGQGPSCSIFRGKASSNADVGLFICASNNACRTVALPYTGCFFRSGPLVFEKVLTGETRGLILCHRTRPRDF